MLHLVRRHPPALSGDKCLRNVAELRGDEERPQNSFELILTFVHVLVAALLLMDTVKLLFGGMKVLSLEKSFLPRTGSRNRSEKKVDL